MKKSFYIKSFLLIMILFSWSCNEKIMDYSNPNALGTDNYFNTPEQIQKATIATYNAYYYNAMLPQSWTEIFDVLGNEADAATPAYGESQVIAMWKYQFNGSNTNISGLWRMLYKMVLRANLTIDKGEIYLKDKGDNVLVSQSIGEAYFLRGWAYSQLAFYYGRVPIRTNYEQNTNINAPRASKVEDVWAVAESDLKKAQQILPDSYDATNLGRATNGAATGFLGKLYLYNKQYAKADSQFVKLEGRYSLLPMAKRDDNFGETNENNSECVFEVQLAWNVGNDIWGNFTDPNENNAPCTQNWRPQFYSWLDWGNWRFQPLRINDFKYSDESGNQYVDPRAFSTFYEKHSATSIGDSTYDKLGKAGIKKFTQVYPWYKKGTNKEIRLSENTGQSGNNVRLMRYADVLLMRAECKLQTGDIVGSLGFINQVRDRVGAFKYLGTYSKDQVFELLKRERILELVGEQSRYNDLKRWGILKETINPELQAMGMTPNVTDQHYIFPIPQIEIDSNLGLGAVENGWN